jgi:hypothetical protein
LIFASRALDWLLASWIRAEKPILVASIFTLAFAPCRPARPNLPKCRLDDRRRLDVGERPAESLDAEAATQAGAAGGLESEDCGLPFSQNEDDLLHQRATALFRQPATKSLALRGDRRKRRREDTVHVMPPRLSVHLLARAAC